MRAWSKLLRSILGVFRGLRAGKRQAWTLLTTEGSGLTAGKQRAVAWVCGRSCRGAFQGFSGLRAGKRQAWTPLTTEGSGLSWQTAGLNALNNRGQWHECLVEAAAEHFTGFRGLRAGKRQLWTPLTTEVSGLTAGKRQAWTPSTTDGSGTAGKRQAWTRLTTEGSGIAAEHVRGLRGLRAGKRHLNNRGQWPDGWQTAGLNALNDRWQWHECLVEAAAEHVIVGAGERQGSGKPTKTGSTPAGGPRRRFCLGEGRGRRIYIYIVYIYIDSVYIYILIYNYISK